jgi:hypothetical protein
MDRPSGLAQQLEPILATTFQAAVWVIVATIVAALAQALFGPLFNFVVPSAAYVGAFAFFGGSLGLLAIVSVLART